MRNVVRAAALLFLLPLVQACDNPTNPDASQDFGNVVWKSDGSGMVGFFQRFSTTTPTSVAWSIGLFNGDGTIGGTVPTSATFSNAYYPAVLSLSQDGKQAVAQLGEDLYEIDIPSGSQTLLATKVNLMVTSPDLKYAIVSPSPVDRQTITVSVLDVSARPVREVTKFDPGIVLKSSGLWLQNGEFAVTLNNGAWQMNIYDTTGTLRDTVTSAIEVFHNGSFIPQTGDIYFLLPVSASFSGIDRYNMNTKARTHIFADENVDNFDISADGTLGAMVTSSGLYAINTQTSARAFITSDLVWGAFLSPDAKHVAYIHARGDNQYFDEIYVSGISRP